MTLKSNIHFSQNLCSDVNALLQGVSPEQLFILTDTNSAKHCLPLLGTLMNDAKIIEVPNGDSTKNLQTIEQIWSFLCSNGGTRHSVMLNLGGGVITDMGGFAASTFKRGIRFINIPTTLLSMVDAAIGGKTGFNFNGLKNEIGVINQPSDVIISADFLKTLPITELLSGYAEVIKHGLISNNAYLSTILSIDLAKPDVKGLQDIIRESIDIKSKIVEQDPTEKGVRKTLNLGHTIGHALESFSLKKGNALPHGYAVAYGLIAELYLSYKMYKFPKETLVSVSRYIKEYYGAYNIGCDDYPTLFNLMLHDKKNTSATEVNFTLLSGVGTPVLNCTADQNAIFQSLDFYRDTVGL